MQLDELSSDNLDWRDAIHMSDKELTARFIDAARSPGASRLNHSLAERGSQSDEAVAIGHPYAVEVAKGG